MKRITLCCALLLQLPALSNSHAADTAPAWQRCTEMQDKAPAQSELDCYRKLAQAGEAPQKISLMPQRATGLEQEWTPSNAPLSLYKLNYALIYARSSQPNNAPTSPNPLNQMAASQLDDRDMKFQFSIKHDLADFERYGSLWLAYSQLSFWQVYDQTNSRPFRENNYEPELIYSIRPNDLFGNHPLTPGIVNFGFVHQSNGQAKPRSRSWNRLYVQAGIERSYSGERRFIALLRAWRKINEDPIADDNADITDYQGHGDLELRYSQNRFWEASLILKPRSVQLDLAAPWSAWRLLTLAAPGAHNTNIHLQYFSGYGESLIDYNQRHDTWGVGLSFPFE